MPLKPIKRTSTFAIQSPVIREFIEDDSCLQCIYQHQREALQALLRHHQQLVAKPQRWQDRIALINIPTGAGKAGVVVLAPYVLAANRVLVVTPSIIVARQLYKAFCNREGTEAAFMLQRGIVNNVADLSPMIPRTSQASLESADEVKAMVKDSNQELVITNIQKIGSHENSHARLEDLDPHAFDLIIVDEAHHYPARTWLAFVNHFQNAHQLIFMTATAYLGQQSLKETKNYILGGAIGLSPEVRPCYYLSAEDAISKGILRLTLFKQIGNKNDSEVDVASVRDFSNFINL